MDYFGLKSLDELPDIQQMEDELEEELPMDLFLIVIKKRTQCLKQQKARKLKQWKDYKSNCSCWVTSRRKAEELIVKGRVKVNGQVVKELGTQVSKQDTVEVDGVPIYQEEYGYYLFYKPRGVISAVSDDKGRKVVTDYFTDVTERIYPVGRLDYDTSGLLLLTNDGSFSQN